jgi:hypothetical protein
MIVGQCPTGRVPVFSIHEHERHDHGTREQIHHRILQSGCGGGLTSFAEGSPPSPVIIVLSILNRFRCMERSRTRTFRVALRGVGLSNVYFSSPSLVVFVTVYRAPRRRVYRYATIRLFSVPFGARRRIYPCATIRPLSAAPFHALPESIAFLELTARYRERFCKCLKFTSLDYDHITAILLLGGMNRRITRLG